MGRIGVSYEEVAEIANQLQKEGRPPTLEAVRRILKTGSKTTLTKYLQDWRNQQGIDHASDVAVPNELSEVVNNLWQHLQHRCEKKMDECQKEADNKIQHMQAQYLSVQQQNTTLQTHTQQLEEELKQATTVHQELQQALVAEQQDKATLTERVVAMAEKHEAAQQEIGRLHHLLNHVQQNLEHYQTAMQQLRQEESLKTDKLRADYEQKLSELQRYLTTLVNEKAQYQAKAEQLLLTNEKSRIDYESLYRDLQTSKTQYQMLVVSHETLQQQYNQLTTHHQNITEHLEQSQRTLISLEVQLNAVVAREATLEATISKLEDKNQALNHEYQFMAQEKANLAGQLQSLSRTEIKK